MANRPQTEKLKKLNLFLHSCGRLFSAKPGGFCKRCGPDEVVTIAPKPTLRKAKPVVNAIEHDAAPVMDEARRAKNEAAREKRAARRAGLGSALPPI